MTFDPDAIERFVFAGWEYRRESRQVLLRYRLDPGHEFTETFRFSGATRDPDIKDIEPLIRLLHLMAGVSYFKAACPPDIVAEYALPSDLARFVEKVYRQGLGEFAYQNDLGNLHQRLAIPENDDQPSRPDTSELLINQGIVVPLGGGKDSLVSVDLLQRAGYEFRTISVGQSPLIEEVANLVGHDHIRIERQLDPHLFALNRAGALNGHVPISAILAAAIALGAAFYDYDTIVMSNEGSAESPNTTLEDGFEVNHQYSKSFDFERAVAQQLANLTNGRLRYFSLLRPWSELAIMRYFSGLDRFHDVFSSCNGNFRIRGAPGQRWCGNCPKCRFVFLALAPWMARKRVTEIFGRDLLLEDAQSTGFEELLGLQGIKPFECVGEIDESRAALTRLSELAQWSGEPRIRSWMARIDPVPMASLMTPGSQHAIPDEFAELDLEA